MLKLRASSGVTLIELLIGMALLGILMALGIPAFSNYMANARIRAAAANFHAAAQLARTEAIRRNGSVEIILTDDAVNGNASTNNLSLTGRNWMVRSLNPGSTDTYTLLQAKSAQEGSASAGSGSGVLVTGSTSRVTFNGLGGTNVGAAATFAFTNPSGGDCANSSGEGPMRCLDVRISTSGQTRLCDPVVAAGDTRACN